MMSTKPKPNPPYKVIGKGRDAYIVDAYGFMVIHAVQIAPSYDGKYGKTIMKIICDALNRKEEL